jgi:hypothetical protein
MNKPVARFLPVNKLLVIELLMLLCCLSSQAKNIIKIYPAPKGAALSSAYKVAVGNRAVPVYLAKVGAADAGRRFKAVDDLLHSEDYYDTAAFAYFDMEGGSAVKISINKPIKSVKVLPSSAGIKATIRANTVTFNVTAPRNLTIEINGQTVKSLHLFINSIDKNIPAPNDPNVIFFGPGIHEVSRMIIGDNKTVYLAGGAIVKAVIDPKERYFVEPSGLKGYEPTFELRGNHIRFRGRGIIDASACTTHARNMININGTDISVEGVILVNSSGWTVPIRRSANVSVDNIKILGYRANTDGIDICNSSNVTVANCFVRTNDDLIVVKTQAGEGKADHIVVKKCVLWNQLANAMSLGYELREDVNDVLFTDCDVIHDTSRAWCMGIFQTDDSFVSNITFSNIRLEEAHQFICLDIKQALESHSKTRGHISKVTFTDVRANGSPLNIDIVGAGPQNRVEGVYFNRMVLNGRPLTGDIVKTNAFTSDIMLRP